MGLIIKGDFDTSYGSAREIYITVGSFHFKKYTGIVFFNITYWLKKDYADRYYTKYEGQKTFTEPKGKLSEQIVYYPEDLSDPKDFILPHSLEFFLGTPKEIAVPLLKSVERKEQVPYVTFDDEGNEVIKHREETVKTDIVDKPSVTETRNVLDLSKLNNIYSLGYEKIIEKLSAFFPKDSFIND